MQRTQSPSTTTLPTATPTPTPTLLQRPVQLLLSLLVLVLLLASAQAQAQNIGECVKRKREDAKKSTKTTQQQRQQQKQGETARQTNFLWCLFRCCSDFCCHSAALLLLCPFTLFFITHFSVVFVVLVVGEINFCIRALPLSLPFDFRFSFMRFFPRS